MTGMTSPHSYPNDSWPKQTTNELTTLSPREQTLKSSAYLYPIDESEEFHDPFSDINLFLAKKVKQSLTHHGSANRWSSKIQSDLLSKILPEFSSKFPKYRLGLSALKKVWEKVMYYSEKVASQKEAMTNEGHVNIAYMIRENLKKYPIKQVSVDIHPYNYSYQLAVKMSECIATLDGERPSLERLTKTIWSAQKHLLPRALVENKCPYEQYDNSDKIIVKTQLELTSKKCYLSQQSLESDIKSELLRMQNLSNEIDESDYVSLISWVAAKKLQKQAASDMQLNESEIEQIRRLIRRQFSMCPKPKSVSTSLYHIEMVRRIASLYQHLIGVPKDLKPEDLKPAVESIFAMATGDGTATLSDVNPLIINFINSQLSFMKQYFDRFDSEEFYEIIRMCYAQSQKLPQIRPDQQSLLEILVWNEIDTTASNYSNETQNLIEEEMANVYLENPESTFPKCVHSVAQYFKRIKQISFDLDGLEKDSLKNLSHLTELEHKIYDWSIQNELISGKVKFDEQTFILKLILKEWKNQYLDEEDVNHEEFVSEIASLVLEKYPHLLPFEEQLASRIWILYKFTWYNALSTPTESTFDRYIKWNKALYRSENLSSAELRDKMEKLCEKVLPLTPFSHEHFGMQTE